MSAPEPKSSKPLPRRLKFLRVLGGVLLFFSVLGLASVAVGVYFTVVEASRSEWMPPFLIGGFGIAVVLMGVVGYRVLRINTLEELETQSRSRWLERLQSPNTSLERTRDR